MSSAENSDQHADGYGNVTEFADLSLDLRKFTELVEKQQALFAAETQRLLVEAADGTLFARCPEQPDKCNGDLLIQGVGTIRCPADPCPHRPARDAYADACILRACGFEFAERHPQMDLVPKEYQEPLRRYCTTIHDRRKTGSGLVLQGAVGCGKTTAMGFIALAAAKAGYSFQMVESAALVGKINYLQRSGRHNDFDGEQREARDIEEQCMDVDFLFIDDFGAESADDLARCWDRYSAIINQRYRRNMPVLLTTNLEDAALTGKQAYTRVMSRIASRNPKIATQAKSQRARASIDNW